MINYKAIISIIIVIIQISASLLYIVDTIKGKTKPNRVTYLLWGVLVIAGFASLSVQFSWSALPVLAGGILPLIIFLCSFVNKNAYWKLKRLDYACGTLAVLALILWWITNDPLLAILFAVLADLLAGIPTLIKIAKYPETETKKAYYLYAIAHTLNLLTISTWILTEFITPLYLVTFCWLIVAAFYFKRGKHEKTN